MSQVDGSAALRVRGEGPSAAKAVQLVQEYGLVLTELVRSRLAPLGLVPFDPAHARGGRLSPHWGRNVVAGALLGAIAGLGAFVVRWPAVRWPVVRWPALRWPERERLPGPPPQAPAPVARKPEARRSEPLRRPPAPQPEPEPPAGPPPAPSKWSLPELRRRVEAAREAQPERAHEWETYLAVLAQQEVDGVLPTSLDAIIDDVFGSLLY